MSSLGSPPPIRFFNSSFPDLARNFAKIVHKIIIFNVQNNNRKSEITFLSSRMTKIHAHIPLFFYMKYDWKKSRCDLMKR